MDEKNLIQRLKDGDTVAFELLYKLYWARVYNFSKLYITSQSDVEEIVQEVFIKLWESRTSLDETKHFEGFLFIMTRNMIFNRSRASFNKTFYQMTVLEAVVDSYDVEQEIEASDLRKHLEAMVGTLSPRQQEIFRLSREQHLTYKEIAESLQISERTVEHHISDVLRFLKRNLKLYMCFISF